MSNAIWEARASALRAAAITAAWRQWRALGASAAAEPAQSVVDPEALILVTLVLAPSEPRLADLWRSWVVLNAELLSVQRAKNLAKRFPPVVRQSLSVVAAVAFGEARDWRWKHLSVQGAVPPGRVGKRRAISASFDSAATLVLQLRRGLGVGIKADTLAFLLTAGHSGSTAADVAEGISYTVSNVRGALDDLAAAHFILAGPPAGRTVGRAAAVFAARPDQWASLLGLGTPLPPWCFWSDRFAFAAEFLLWVDEVRGRSVSEYAFAAKLEDLVASYPRAFPFSWDLTGPAPVQRAGSARATEDLDRLTRTMGQNP